ncbi:condensation domain-containing protein [Crocosphaera sp. UHCC 0190]|uniref:condensation domain-containing protein n=1 Tax=Crocosphaera sp. UHCC 0190 TaxID=3110246 RepID=UPI002B20699B|nr:condensation domain-containing protein [Crocosphaera sp. UHCC 0190]MEA5510548.1 condensation domain-containing protein [Crocosphaera sp. UHCC 0190]
MKHPEIWESVRTLMRFRNEAPPLQPVERKDNLPLSFPQERLWLLDQLNPGSADYNVPYGFRVRGELNVEALEKSFNALRLRHEILRTTFHSSDGHPVQVIAPVDPQPLLTMDLTTYPEGDRFSKALQLADEEAERPFNLSTGPLFRTTLIKLTSDSYFVLITLHHIVYDAWSDGVLFRELAELYQTFSSGQSLPSLPDLPIQYADFAVWQRQWLQGEFLDTLLNFWQGQLSDLPSQQLPADRTKPPISSGQRERQVLVLPKELSEKLNTFTSEEGVTPFITLLAAFKVLLHTYLGQDEVFLCTPIANRNRSEIQKLIGYFVNLIIYRSNLSGNPSFREFLGQVRHQSAQAYAHQDLPIQLLVSRLNLINVPLSQIMFALQNVVLQNPKLRDLTITSLEEQRGTDFDLFLSMEEDKGELSAVLKYNVDLFEETTITQMLQHYQTVLENIVAEPEQPISQLLPLTDAQKQQFQEKRDRQQDSTESQSQASANFVKPQDQLELQLTQIWEGIFNTHSLSVTDNFFALGGKSLLAIRLLNQIEEKFGKKLPLNTLVEFPTIEKLANILRQEEITIPWIPVVPLQAKGDKPPLFLLPPAACTALHYTDLAHYFAPERPVYGLEQLGMDGKDKPHDNVEEMAAYYVEKIQAIQPHGPYFLAGRCMGGIVAFEIALQMQAKGETVALLAIIDTQSPPRLKPRDFWYYVSEFFKRLRHPKFILSFFQKFLTKTKTTFSDDPQGRQIHYVHMTHAKARKKYIPKRLFSGTIELFKNDSESLEAQKGWKKLVRGVVNEHIIEGDHETMLDEPHVQQFVNSLKDCINQNISTTENLPCSSRNYP